MKNLKSKVFQIAHSIKSQFDNWSQTLKAAWKIAKMFFGNTVNIEFAKEDGEVRKAEVLGIGSLNTLKSGFVRFLEMKNGKTQWRSFRLERLILN